MRTPASPLALPALRGGLLALLAAALFGISTPLVQRFGAGLGPFSTAALLYAGAAAVGLLLGKAELAFDNTERAITAFKQVRERKKDHKVTRYDESPKVIEAWKQAGGLVQD